MVINLEVLLKLMYCCFSVFNGNGLNFFPGVSEQECSSISGILTAVKAHATTLEILRENHSGQSASMEQKALDTFQQKYMVCDFASYS